jgi:hypothetical protein
MSNKKREAEAFAELIRKTKVNANTIRFGHFLLKGKKGINK